MGIPREFCPSVMLRREQQNVPFKRLSPAGGLGNRSAATLQLGGDTPRGAPFPFQLPQCWSSHVLEGMYILI